MGVQGVLFDLGSVLVKADVDDLDDLASRVGESPRKLAAVLLGDYAANTDHPLHRAERGELRLTEAIDLMEIDARREGFSLEAIRPTLLRPTTEVNQELVEEVRRLRGAGVRTGLITNSVLEYAGLVDGVLPHDELFDVVIDSCRVALRKPDPRIFMLALEAIGLDPQDVLFVDDQPGNVAAAAALGMQTIVASEYSRIAEQVRRAVPANSR